MPRWCIDRDISSAQRLNHNHHNHRNHHILVLLILFEQWAGHRLLSDKVTRPHVRANRPILIPSVPVSEGIEIRHGCQFISSLVRALVKLPGGLGRFLPCGLGSHMSRSWFTPWSLPRVGNGGGKKQSVTPGHLLDEGSNTGKRVRLTRKTRPGASFHVIPDPGHPTPRSWKRLRPPSSEGVGE